LEAFIVRREERAFAALVHRHGPMVLNVCRRVLRDAFAAEDAFQATFFVLARKAQAVGNRELVGHWLYRVAYHAALRAKATSQRQRLTERQVSDMSRRELSCEPNGDELQPLLDEELNRLPEKYRIPLVLCELEGRTRKEVARNLGCPEGTLSSRLARARELLAGRLRKRGLLCSTGLTAAVFASGTQAALPPALVGSTVRAAMLFALGSALAGGTLSPQAAALAEGVMRTMWLTKLKLVLLAFVALALLGTGIGALLQAGGPPPDAAPASVANTPAKHKSPARVRSCILLWMSGGPSQLDTFDLKPNAPAEIRGEFKPIATNVPGIEISEHLPKIARFMDQMVIIRSLNSGEASHDRGTFFMHTGSRLGAAIQYPPLESVLTKELGKGRAEQVAAAERKAADLTEERPEVRKAYGDSKFGEDCLRARRLVERQVPFVEVTLGGWDTHGNNFAAVKGLSATLDSGWSALMADLKERGLLDTTLIVWMGEFGRTPRINQNSGRDHWANGFSVVVAGCGMRGGQVIGRTSVDGAKIEERPVTVPELFATIYQLMGVDHTKVYDAKAEPIKEILPWKKQARINALIGELSAGDFKSRQDAAAELDRLGSLALPALKTMAAAPTDLDLRVRVEQLIAGIERRLAGEDKKWAEFGYAPHSLKRRLGEIFKRTPWLSEREIVTTLYLLTVARAPTEAEWAEAEKRFESGVYPAALFELAWGLVRSREFSADIAGANAQVRNYWANLRVPRATYNELKNKLGKSSVLPREAAAALIKAPLSDEQLVETIFLITLARKPVQTDWDAILQHRKALEQQLGPGAVRQRLAEDLIAALLDCHEFRFGH
jgi:RNA polymerase sigma factor (sigma-70 family)